MIALISAILLATSAVSVAPVADRPAVMVNYFGMEDIAPAPIPGGYTLYGEASLVLGSKTVMYDLAGRKSNGDLVFAAPRTATTKKWNWYSTGMFTTTTWF